jgi:thiosulfate dehydrogenase
VPILPDDTLAAHAPPAYSPRTQRLVFIEKTRHGGFLNYGGEMPPFSLETLPDTDLSDILEALGVTGQ